MGFHYEGSRKDKKRKKKIKRGHLKNFKGEVYSYVGGFGGKGVYPGPGETKGQEIYNKDLTKDVRAASRSMRKGFSKSHRNDYKGGSRTGRSGERMGREKGKKKAD